MQFLCLGYVNEAAVDALSEGEKTELFKECFAQCVPFRATGKVRAEEGLELAAKTKTLLPKSGKTVVTDGPYIDTKEGIGAFFIIEADSMEEAIEVASLHPGARMGEELGFAIEIRPIQSGLSA